MNRSSHTSPTLRPRAASEKNAGMHAILDAALGLTSLGAPSPTSSSRSTIKRQRLDVSSSPPSRPIMKEMIAADAAATARRVTHDVYNKQQPMMFMDSSILQQPPVYHHHHSIAPSAGALPRYPLKNSFHSDAAMTIDCYSVSERVAMMDRAAAYAASAPGPSLHIPASASGLYDPYRFPHPGAASYPQSNMGTVSASAPVSDYHSMIVNPYDENNDENITKTFPELLLEIMSDEANAHIVSWLPHGKGFIVHDKQRFTEYILPKYFDGAKFTSFTRRLKRWNFVRVPRGPELGAYFNKNFQRDRPELLEKMRYRKEGGIGGAKQFNKATSAKISKVKVQPQGATAENNDAIKEEEKEVEEKQRVVESNKVQGTSSIKKEHQDTSSQDAKDDLDLAESSNHHPILRGHILASSKISPETKQYYFNSENAPMPLPSTLPKKRHDNSNKGTAPAALEQRLASSSTSELKSALMLAQAKALHRASNASTTSFVSPHESAHDRHVIEMQRELLLARSMLSRNNEFNSPSTGHHHGYHTGYEHHHPGDATSRVLRNHQGMAHLDSFVVSPRSQYHHVKNNMIAADHNSMRDYSMRSLAPPFIPRQDMTSSPSSLEEELRRHTAATMSNNGDHHLRHLSKTDQPKMKQVVDAVPTSQRDGEVTASERSSSSTISGGGSVEKEARLVMMTREDEEHFAKYLLEQRRMNRGLTTAV